MATKRKQEYALAEDGDGRLSPVAVERGASSISSVPGLSEEQVRAIKAEEALRWLVSRIDGWLRVGGGNTEKTNFWKFKFASGQFRGYYVMYVAGIGNWSEGVLGLAEKVKEVDAGTRRPVKDDFYKDWD